MRRIIFICVGLNLLGISFSHAAHMTEENFLKNAAIVLNHNVTKAEWQKAWEKVEDLAIYGHKLAFELVIMRPKNILEKACFVKNFLANDLNVNTVNNIRDYISKNIQEFPQFLNVLRQLINLDEDRVFITQNLNRIVPLIQRN